MHDPHAPAAPDPTARKRGASAVTLIGVLLALVATNVLVTAILPSWAYIPAMLAASVGAVLVARKRGATLDDLGLAGPHARRSLLIGLGVGAVIAAGIFGALAVPGIRGVFADERVAGLGQPVGVQNQTVTRIDGHQT